MISLVRRFVYWSKIDQDIKNIVMSCRRCSLSAKSPTVIYQPWPNAVKYLRLDYIEIARDMWMVVMSWLSSSFSKWLEIFKWRNITSIVNVKFLHELVSRFGFLDILWVNFKHVCQYYAVEHVTTKPYHPTMLKILLIHNTASRISPQKLMLKNKFKSVLDKFLPAKKSLKILKVRNYL